MGFDLMHLNLHKTFATPHGGGGPGSGPLGAHSRLARFLPGPLVSRDEKGRYLFNDPDPESIGDMKAFWGNIGVIIRAAAYVDALGRSGLRRTAENAILAANYLRVRLRECYSIPFDRPCMHEFVMTPDAERSPAKTLDIAKRLPDYGMHAPTVYFPLIVKEALMIEPTETESLKTLDAFVDAMLRIAREAKENPEILKSAPRSAYRSRLDEVLAARRPRLKWGDA
jgi:glycine dehydrogenase subunit 2